VAASLLFQLEARRLVIHATKFSERAIVYRRAVYGAKRDNHELRRNALRPSTAPFYITQSSSGGENRDGLVFANDERP